MLILADHREGGDPEEVDSNALALEGRDANFAVRARHDVGGAQVVEHVVLGDDAGGHRILHEHVADHSLVPQLELDRADHADAEASNAVDLIAEDQRHLALLVLDGGGPSASDLAALDDLLHVVVRLLGDLLLGSPRSESGGHLVFPSCLLLWWGSVRTPA
jgi:hypothetical protein